MYNNELDLIAAIENYFVSLKGEKQKNEEDGTEEWVRLPEPCTITGLALALGFESRQSIYDYEKNGEFSYIIKNARLRVECEYEKNLVRSNSPAGSIFALKNMGWKDKSENEIYGKDGAPIESKHIVEFHDFSNGHKPEVQP